MSNYSGEQTESYPPTSAAPTANSQVPQSYGYTHTSVAPHSQQSNAGYDPSYDYTETGASNWQSNAENHQEYPTAIPVYGANSASGSQEDTQKSEYRLVARNEVAEDLRGSYDILHSQVKVAIENYRAFKRQKRAFEPGMTRRIVGGLMPNHAKDLANAFNALFKFDDWGQLGEANREIICQESLNLCIDETKKGLEKLEKRK
jgi:hypothetical protein